MMVDKAYLAAENFSVADIDLLVLVEFAGWRKLALPSTSKNALRWYQQIRERSSAKL
jgi:glutathione S-transferase